MHIAFQGKTDPEQSVLRQTLKVRFLNFHKQVKWSNHLKEGHKLENSHSKIQCWQKKEQYLQKFPRKEKVTSRILHLGDRQLRVTEEKFLCFEEKTLPTKRWLEKPWQKDWQWAPIPYW